MRSSVPSILICFLLCLYGYVVSAQISAPGLEALQDRYPHYKESVITKKRFGIEDLVPVFERHNENSGLEFSVRAHSLLDRPIYLASFGEGDIPILLWSQMHGDESTATMALLDLFNYLASPQPEDQKFVDAIHERTSLYMIPMLNPDGASKFQRRNAAGIDLNRDALNLSNPESWLLKAVRDSLKPDFGFNLHDQSIYYRAGQEGQQVALAFLAPAYDHGKNINEVRFRSMQLIAHLYDSLQLLIPDRIAIYDDSFEPRAFGDNIMKWGTSSVLIESGGYPGDHEKQYLRELNFLTLVKALESIITGSYTDKTVHEYQAIPENKRRMMSLIIEDLEVPVSGRKIRMDVGYLYQEEVTDEETLFPASIVDVGDLSTYSGFQEFPAGELEVLPGKWYSTPFTDARSLAVSDWMSLVRQGYLGFILESEMSDIDPQTSFLICKSPGEKDDRLEMDISPGNNPTFILQSGHTGERWIVHNGKVHTAESFMDSLHKTLIHLR